MCVWVLLYKRWTDTKEVSGEKKGECEKKDVVGEESSKVRPFLGVRKIFFSKKKGGGM